MIELDGGDLVAVGDFTHALTAGGRVNAYAEGRSDLFAIRLVGEDGSAQWSHATGGGGDESVHAAFPAPSQGGGGSGEIIIVGSFEGELEEDASVVASSAGARDMLVLRWNIDGGLVDADAFGGPGDDLQVGADDSVVAAGWLEGQVQFGWWSIVSPDGGPGSGADANCVVVKYGAQGELYWAYSHGSVLGNEECAGVGVLPDGQVMLSGGFSEPLTIGSQHFAPKSGFDVFMTRLDPRRSHPRRARG